MVSYQCFPTQPQNTRALTMSRENQDENKTAFPPPPNFSLMTLLFFSLCQVGPRSDTVSKNHVSFLKPSLSLLHSCLWVAVD